MCRTFQWKNSDKKKIYKKECWNRGYVVDLKKRIQWLWNCNKFPTIDKLEKGTKKETLGKRRRDIYLKEMEINWRTRSNPKSLRRTGRIFLHEFMEKRGGNLLYLMCSSVVESFLHFTLHGFSRLKRMPVLTKIHLSPLISPSFYSPFPPVLCLVSASVNSHDQRINTSIDIFDRRIRKMRKHKSSMEKVSSGENEKEKSKRLMNFCVIPF